MQFRTITRRMFAPRNLAATVVLTFAVAGVAYAAIGSKQIMNNSLTSLDIKNNSLTSLDIKNESLTGADLKNKSLRGRDLADNSVTGNQVDESTLGKVANAAHADTADSATNATNATNATSAANAAKLDGKGSSEFVQTQNLVHVYESMNVGDPHKTLVTNGDISVKLGCDLDAGTEYLRVYATTSTNGAILESEEDDVDPLETTTAADDSEITYASTGATTKSVDTGYDETGWVISSDGKRVVTLLEGSSSFVQNAFGKDCSYGGTFMVKATA